MKSVNRRPAPTTRSHKYHSVPASSKSHTDQLCIRLHGSTQCSIPEQCLLIVGLALLLLLVVPTRRRMLSCMLGHFSMPSPGFLCWCKYYSTQYLQFPPCKIDFYVNNVVYSYSQSMRRLFLFFHVIDLCELPAGSL